MTQKIFIHNPDFIKKQKLWQGLKGTLKKVLHDIVSSTGLRVGTQKCGKVVTLWMKLTDICDSMYL